MAGFVHDICQCGDPVRIGSIIGVGEYISVSVPYRMDEPSFWLFDFLYLDGSPVKEYLSRKNASVWISS